MKQESKPKPRKSPFDFTCKTHPNRPAHNPSKVLCKECFDKLDAKWRRK